MEEIIISYDVRSFLRTLIITLHQKEYFGFLETAENYVNNLIDEILQLHQAIHYKTPEALQHYGNYYVKIKSNKRTTWYVFFDKYENRCFVEFITNNHAPQSAFLNAL